MAIGNLSGEHHDNRVTPDVASAPRDLSVRIEHDTESFASRVANQAVRGTLTSDRSGYACALANSWPVTRPTSQASQLSSS